MPTLFEGTAAYYARYRFGYPAPVIDFLVQRFALTSTTHVLDLGCGTGQLAIPLSSRGVPVRAVDPDVEMLAEGLRAESRNPGRAIEWQRGDDASLPALALPHLSCCMMGASFHWTNRDELLQNLDPLIMANGGVVLLDSDHGVWSGPGREWNAIAQAVITQFLGPQRRAANEVYSHPTDRHEVVLARSAFGNVESHTFKDKKTLTLDDIVGLQLSMSYASPALLGDRLEAFRSTLRDRLQAEIPSGVVDGTVSYEVLIGTRTLEQIPWHQSTIPQVTQPTRPRL